MKTLWPSPAASARRFSNTPVWTQALQKGPNSIFGKSSNNQRTSLRRLSEYSTTERRRKKQNKKEREEREDDREKERQQKENVRYLMLATALQGQTPRGHGKGKKPTQVESPWGPCFRCGNKGHWVKLCLNPQPPPGPCLLCKKTGHWTVDCLSASSRGTRLLSSVGEAASEFAVPDLLGLAAED